MRIAAGWLATFLILLCTAVMSAAFTNGPPPEYSGAPPEPDCHACHDGNPRNLDGQLQILDAPLLYREGRTYRITIRITSSQTSAAPSPKWGFQLTAVRTATGEGAGTFVDVSGENTTIVTGINDPTRRYIEQTSAGTHAGTRDAVEWKVDWTAPGAGVGGVDFHAAGIAANGNGSTTGDYVYAATVASDDTTTGIPATTWGELKRRYRR